MKIPSDIAYTKKVGKEIENFLRSKNIDHSTIFDIRLCVEEAVKNSIIHGNKNRKDLPVLISYTLEGDRFSVEIEDRGEGFDPAKIPNPTTDENLLKTSGRGIFIISRLMDEVKYNNKGNKMFMIKCIKNKQGGLNAD